MGHPVGIRKGLFTAVGGGSADHLNICSDRYRSLVNTQLPLQQELDESKSVIISSDVTCPIHTCTFKLSSENDNIFHIIDQI